MLMKWVEQVSYISFRKANILKIEKYPLTMLTLQLNKESDPLGPDTHTCTCPREPLELKGAH